MTNPILDLKAETFFTTMDIEYYDNKTGDIDTIQLRETIACSHSTMAGFRAITNGITWAAKQPITVKSYTLGVKAVIDLERKHRSNNETA